jgi:hypothetical protein
VESHKKYKIAIIILSILVVAEAVLLIHFWKAAAPRLVRPVFIKGKIAIVLDDWGYNLKNLDLLEEINYPLTISVLPNLPYSSIVAQEGQKKGREVILHLPMEPYEKYNLEKNTILVSMDEPTIRDIVSGDLANLKGVKGVSNHMGSKATDDLRTIGIVFKELKKKGMYFLDSSVSPNSVCLDLAHKMHLGFTKRDVFIDNKQEPDYIKGQVNKLKTRARIYGQVIGIGHDRKTTLEVLKEVMPQLEKEGYRFVFVSELVK